MVDERGNLRYFRGGKNKHMHFTWGFPVVLFSKKLYKLQTKILSWI